MSTAVYLKLALRSCFHPATTLSASLLLNRFDIRSWRPERMLIISYMLFLRVLTPIFACAYTYWL